MADRDSSDGESFRFRRFDAIIGTIRTVFKLAFWAFVAYQVREIVSVLAGKTTPADITLNILKSGKRDFVAYGVGSLALLWGAFQRRLRRRTVKHLKARLKALERQLDPGRSSSHLTSTGDTRPEDQ